MIITVANMKIIITCTHKDSLGIVHDKGSFVTDTNQMTCEQRQRLTAITNKDYVRYIPEPNVDVYTIIICGLHKDSSYTYSHDDIKCFLDLLYFDSV